MHPSYLIALLFVTPSYSLSRTHTYTHPSHPSCHSSKGRTLKGMLYIRNGTEGISYRCLSNAAGSSSRMLDRTFPSPSTPSSSRHGKEFSSGSSPFNARGISSNAGDRRFSGGAPGGGGGGERMDKETFTSIKRGNELINRSKQSVGLAIGGSAMLAVAKLAVWWRTGSSSMMAEAVHSVADCANNYLLMLGLSKASEVPDKSHQYGYGKNVYFFSLMSALGTFFIGAGSTLTYSVKDLMDPQVAIDSIGMEAMGVLGLSFVVDSIVLYSTSKAIFMAKPKELSHWQHIKKLKDPTLLTLLLEDGASTVGSVLAAVCITLSKVTSNSVFDSFGGIIIGSMLGGIAVVLIRLNQRFLIGSSVDREIEEGIENILLARNATDAVSSVQTQWVGPFTFSYKAEVDLDGTFLAAQLMKEYEREFSKIFGWRFPETKEGWNHPVATTELTPNELQRELRFLLSLYAEDVVRAVEREVKHAEAQIREAYPEAAFIELEPDSKAFNKLALTEGKEENPRFKRLERETLARFMREEERKKIMEEMARVGGNSSRQK
ncbi:unnamed protein product [Chrysoparadoxa australica]